MSAAEYWDGDCELVTGYREAFKIRMENQERMADRDAWFLGIYVRKALESVPLLVNGFVPRGVKAQDYPDKPLLQKAQEEKEAADRREREEKQTKTAMAMVQAMFARFNKNFEERQRQEAKAVKT